MEGTKTKSDRTIVWFCVAGNFLCKSEKPRLLDLLNLGTARLVFREDFAHCFSEFPARLGRIFLLVSFLYFLTNIVSAQETKVTPTPQLPILQAKTPDDLIRVNTNLIQTGVSVLDEQGKFVPNLKQEDFDLRVDGRTVPIIFFEELNSQTARKKAVEGNNNESSISLKGQGRKILFMVDDVHLAFDNFERVRTLILKFIEIEKKPEDYIAIASTTGKIGELQKFTNDNEILRSALARLIPSRNYSATDRAFPPMSEFEAQEVERSNKEVIDIFTEISLRDFPPNLQKDVSTIERVREQIHSRAKDILAQSQNVSKATYNALEQALSQSGKLAGRKIVFFISDGFLLDILNTNSSARIDRIINTATRSNAVINTIDAKGLDGSLPEGTAASFRVAAGSRFESQDALSAFAKNTGGSFIHNTNGLLKSVQKALDEAVSFYLLAWEPTDETIKKDKLRQIEVVVRGKLKLEVKFQRGYLSANSQSAGNNEVRGKKDNLPEETKISEGKPKTSPNSELNNALLAGLPIRALPTDLLVNYSEKSEGGFLEGFVQINSGSVEMFHENDRAVGKVELIGVIIDSIGNRVDSFDKLLSLEYPDSTAAKNAVFIFYYEFQTKVKPGLYEIRIASRDLKSGRIGSNLQKIEIPNLATGKMELSSLLLAERKTPALLQDKENPHAEAISEELKPSISKRFDQTSYLQYKFYIYNYQQNLIDSGRLQLDIQIQILKGKTLIAAIPFDKEYLEQTEATQFLYAAEIPLKSLPKGEYQLQVKLLNLTAKTETVQTSNFKIE